MADWLGSLAASCTPVVEEPDEETPEQRQRRRAQQRAAREREEARPRNPTRGARRSRAVGFDDRASSIASDRSERTDRSGLTARSGRTAIDECGRDDPRQRNGHARKPSYELDDLASFDSREDDSDEQDDFRAKQKPLTQTPLSNHSMAARELRQEQERKAAEKRAALYNADEMHLFEDPKVTQRVKGAANVQGWRNDGVSASSAGLEAAGEHPDERCFGVNVVILPQAWYVMYWDVFMMLLLFIIIFLLPYEAAFVSAYSRLSWSAMTDTQRAFMVLNRLMDAFFVIDLCLQFVLGYVDGETQKVVTSLPKIRQRYLKSYFVIDVVSLFPFDRVIESSSTPVIRAIKFLRMLKLLRAMKANRILGRLMSHVDVSHGFIKLCKDCLALAIIVHFLVCAWAYQAAETGGDDPERWIYLNEVNMSRPTYVYITVIQLLFTSSDIQVALIDDMQLKIVSAAVIYALMAFTIAELTDMVAAANAGDAAFTRMIDELNYLMRERNFPMDLRFRLRDFLRFKKDGEADSITSPERQELMKALSPMLQTEVANQLSKLGLKQAPLFKNCKPQILMRVTMAATSTMLGAAEAVSREGEIADHLCVLDHGSLISAGRVVRSGSVFGNECLLAGGFDEVHHAHSTHTMTYSTITKIHVHQLDQIVRKGDPGFWRLMRRRAVSSIAARGLLMYAQLAARQRAPGARGARAIASEMVSLGVGKMVVYKMLLAYRYVNGESDTIEYAARRIQSWYRGARVRAALKVMVFRARVTDAYVPSDMKNVGVGAKQSDFMKVMAKFSVHAEGADDVPTQMKALRHLCDSNAQQIGMLLIENRRMSRTVDSVALLVRKIALGL